MGLKSDRWIKEQNLKSHPMVHPSLSHQVREDTEGRKVVSYGLSSYGYDIRAGKEWKIFTNLNSTVVDPKNFSEDSFVTHIGDRCIIPPNSFALASSMEYIRMPKDTLAVCLGKSTYARCFPGSTRVLLSNGESVSFKEMVAGESEGVEYIGFGVTEYNELVEQKLLIPRLISTGEELVCVDYTDGSYDLCTPDHKIALLSNLYGKAPEILMQEARRLVPGNTVITEHRTFLSIVTCLINRLLGKPTHLPSLPGFHLGTKKVRTITKHPGLHDVYCLTSARTGNFFLSSGTLVANCGIIVNVTPIEPGWHGNITLEFSNTTSLPAVVYSEEGVAQLLFFQGDEECEVSYADREGKYQGQTNITLPKA